MAYYDFADEDQIVDPTPSAGSSPSAYEIQRQQERESYSNTGASSPTLAEALRQQREQERASWDYTPLELQRYQERNSFSGSSSAGANEALTPLQSKQAEERESWNNYIATYSGSLFGNPQDGSTVGEDGSDSDALTEGTTTPAVVFLDMLEPVLRVMAPSLYRQYTGFVEFVFAKGMGLDRNSVSMGLVAEVIFEMIGAAAAWEDAQTLSPDDQKLLDDYVKAFGGSQQSEARVRKAAIKALKGAISDDELDELPTIELIKRWQLTSRLGVKTETEARKVMINDLIQFDRKHRNFPWEQLDTPRLTRLWQDILKAEQAYWMSPESKTSGDPLNTHGRKFINDYGYATWFRELMDGVGRTNAVFSSGKMPEAPKFAPWEDFDTLIETFGGPNKSEAEARRAIIRGLTAANPLEPGRRDPEWEKLDTMDLAYLWLDLLWGEYDRIGILHANTDWKLYADPGMQALAADPRLNYWSRPEAYRKFDAERSTRVTTGLEQITGQPLGNDADVFVSLLAFVGSFFFEPIDWALTADSIWKNIQKKDWGAAAGDLILGIVPGAMAGVFRFGKGGKWLGRLEPNIPAGSRKLNRVTGLAVVREKAMSIAIQRASLAAKASTGKLPLNTLQKIAEKADDALGTGAGLAYIRKIEAMFRSDTLWNADAFKSWLNKTLATADKATTPSRLAELDLMVEAINRGDHVIWGAAGDLVNATRKEAIQLKTGKASQFDTSFMTAAEQLAGTRGETLEKLTGFQKRLKPFGINPSDPTSIKYKISMIVTLDELDKSQGATILKNLKDNPSGNSSVLEGYLKKVQRDIQQKGVKLNVTDIEITIKGANGSQTLNFTVDISSNDIKVTPSTAN